MARRKATESEPPGIVVLYTSLMILLLAFFILLNSLSQTEESKVKAALKSLMSTFGFHQGGMSPLVGLDGGTSRVTAPINPAEADYLSLRGVVQDQGLQEEVQLLRSDSRRAVVIPAGVLFRPGQTELDAQGQKFMAAVADRIKFSDYPLSIYGFTDPGPALDPQGRDNWTISGLRALAVVRFLVAQGVEPSRLAAFGLAGSKPRYPNTSPENRLKNNRVEMVFDARDAAPFHLPEDPSKRRLDFKGFVFDLFKVPINKSEREDEGAGGGGG